MNRFILSVLLLFAAASAALAASPKREMRGVWVATVWGLDWPAVQGVDKGTVARQQRQMLAMLDEYAALNLTTVFFQVRSMADVMYPSKLEPVSAFLTGTRGADATWDPLQFVVSECHRRGLECYAWVNPFRWSAGADYKTPVDLRWKQRGALLTYGKYTVLNPGLEEVRSHIVDICREIVEGYDVDGLVWDDYFYPNRIPETPEAPDYDLWQASAPWMSFGDWRRANVHKTVADVYATIQAVRPDVRFGISPAGVAGKESTSATKWGMEGVAVKADDWQYKEIYSDPLGWLYQGTVDFISPQLYWSSSHKTAPYGPLSQWWSDAAMLYGRHLYTSVTLESLEKGNSEADRREILGQVDSNRLTGPDGAQGTVLYRGKYVGKLASAISAAQFSGKALSPEVRWRSVCDMPAPEGLRLKGNRLSWSPVAPPEGRIVKYAVYAFSKGRQHTGLMASDGDGISAEYLIAVTYEPEFIVADTSLGYAVTALSGLSIESVPTFLR